MLIAFQPVSAQPIETAAEYVHLVDFETGTVLLSKRADERVPPASMAKAMTLAVVFEQIREGRLDPEDEFFVSEHAWRTGGAPSRTATMFAAVNSRVRVTELLRGAMVQAANDACIVLAEGIAGSEAAFAEMMNEKAAELGLRNSRFVNPTGLPGEGQHVSMRDMAILSEHLIREYPDLYAIFSEPEFTWNTIRQLNRNPLMTLGIGVDGLLAGFEEATGYGMAVSALENRQRLVLAAHGMSSANQRVAEVQKLLNWGFRSFERIEIFAANEPVGEIGVYGAGNARVALASPRPIQVLVPRGTTGNLRARIVYTGPVRAPLEAGTPVGVLRVTSDDTVISETPLQTLAGVELAPIHWRALDAAFELVVGLVHSGVEAATNR